MVFHGDYEIEYEIYQKHPTDWRLERLGHVMAISREDALRLWAQEHCLTSHQLEKIDAILGADYV
jgi:hypothetical protein